MDGDDDDVLLRMQGASTWTASLACWRSEVSLPELSVHRWSWFPSPVDSGVLIVDLLFALLLCSVADECKSVALGG